MTLHDGDGWVYCRCGQRHWGLHGAAGLLLVRPAAVPGGSAVEVLLQLRAEWTHQGGSWALPGGARDSHEDAVGAALREAREETGIQAHDLVVLAEHPGVQHGDWSYTYVIAAARHPVVAAPLTTESTQVRWLAPQEVAGLPLLPAFAAAWPALLEVLLAARERGAP